jgi:hypothetical protein
MLIPIFLLDAINSEVPLYISQTLAPFFENLNTKYRFFQQDGATARAASNLMIPYSSFVTCSVAQSGVM